MAKRRTSTPAPTVVGNLTVDPSPATPAPASPEALDALYWPFVRWMSRPLSNDAPKTAQSFADLHGVSLADLKSLKDRPSYPDDLKAATIDWAVESLPTVLHQSFADANSPDAPIASRQKYVEMVTAVQKAAKDAPPSVSVNLFGMDDDRFARILARASKKTVALPAFTDAATDE